MNYYIQGSAARAEEIKAAFEAKGFIPRIAPMYYESESVLFFTGTDNYIYETPSPWVMDIIKTHPDYKELELPVVPKYKDGDVLVTTKIRSCPFIYRKPDFNNDLAYYYVGIDGNGKLSIGWPKRTLCHFGLIADAVIAGQEQRDLLFQKMREAGYEWDEKNKELRKIQPHYDISNFKAGMPVLVRWYSTGRWRYSLYSFYEEDSINPFDTVKGSFTQCIPYNEDTKHLLGTTNMPSEEYINW